MPDADAPKIIVDSDWKSQAQQEKEKLSQQAAQKQAEAAEAQGPVGFEDLVGWLGTQALMYLGYFPDPQTGQAVVSLEYAKLYIDMLGVVESKTTGNLSEKEKEGLTKTLSQLRSEFVEVSKAVAKAVQEGRIKPMARGGAPGGVATASPMPGQSPGPMPGGLTMP